MSDKDTECFAGVLEEHEFFTEAKHMREQQATITSLDKATINAAILHTSNMKIIKEQQATIDEQARESSEATLKLGERAQELHATIEELEVERFTLEQIKRAFTIETTMPTTGRPYIDRVIERLAALKETE